MRVDINRRRLGVTFVKGMAEGLLWAPQAQRAALHVMETGEVIPFKRGQRGYWLVSTAALKPGSSYRFVVNDGPLLPDPASLCQPKGVHGDSKALNPAAFQWEDTDWQSPALDSYIIYELHTGTFSSEGNFEGVIQKLPHLKSLGITAIEIMPVAQFPGSRNWGYDGVFPFAVQSSYGGAEGLQRLVAACHREGLAVVLDVVYNHLGPEGNYLTQFGPYFTDKYRTPWGSAVNFDDAGSDEVRRFFIENALMWFRDFHIDALRLDAVHAIKDFSPKHILREIKEAVEALTQVTGRAHYLIAECDLNDVRFINPADEGGYGMDAQWVDEFHHALWVTCGNERNGYYADFDGVNHLAKAYRDAYVYNGCYSEYRQRTFGTVADAHSGERFLVFSQNHDQVGNRLLGERTSTLVGTELAKVMAATVLTAPFIPLLFMGEEWGETNPFLYFTDHTDEQLVQAVREGRKQEFAAFHSDGLPPDPFAVETFQRSGLQWNLLYQDAHRALFAYYTELIALRRSTPALSDLNRKQLSVICDADRNTLVLQRWSKNSRICCLMNFSGSMQPLPLPAPMANARKVLDSSDERWAGPGASRDAKNATVHLNPRSVVLYKL